MIIEQKLHCPAEPLALRDTPSVQQVLDSMIKVYV